MTGPRAVFQGGAVLNGQPAPNGLPIVARIGTIICGRATVENGRYRLEVAAAATQPGCGTADATVTFTIGGLPARETGTFRLGDPIPLDLSAQQQALPASPLAGPHLAGAGNAPCASARGDTAAGGPACDDQLLVRADGRSLPATPSSSAQTSRATLAETKLEDIRIRRTRPLKIARGGSDSITLTLYIRDEIPPVVTGNPKNPPEPVRVDIPADKRTVVLGQFFGPGYQVVVVAEIDAPGLTITSERRQQDSLNQPSVTWTWSVAAKEGTSQQVSLLIRLEGRRGDGDPERSPLLCCTTFEIGVTSPFVEVGTIKVGAIVSAVLGTVLTGAAGWMKQRLSGSPAKEGQERRDKKRR